MAENKHDHHSDHDIQLPDQHTLEAGHETADVDSWAVGRFGIGMVLVIIIALGLLIGLFKFFEAQEGGPLSKEERILDATKLPPKPQLQETPVLDLKRMRDAEDQILNGYGWLDQSAGSVHIPIGRAIDLISQRGLPARPQAPPASSVTVPTESGLGSKMVPPGGPLAGEVK